MFESYIKKKSKEKEIDYPKLMKLSLIG